MKKKTTRHKSKRRSALNEAFRKFAAATSHVAGSSWAFIAAVLIIVVWALSGPIFHYSDTWQLVINTSTTIITFLMVFLIQNTQNRADKAIQLKLDELLRGVTGARTSMVDIEDLSDDELEHLHRQFARLHEMEKKHPTATSHSEVDDEDE